MGRRIFPVVTTLVLAACKPAANTSATKAEGGTSSADYTKMKINSYLKKRDGGSGNVDLFNISVGPIINIRASVPELPPENIVAISFFSQGDGDSRLQSVFYLRSTDRVLDDGMTKKLHLSESDFRTVEARLGAGTSQMSFKEGVDSTVSYKNGTMTLTLEGGGLQRTASAICTGSFGGVKKAEHKVKKPDGTTNGSFYYSLDEVLPPKDDPRQQ